MVFNVYCALRVTALVDWLFVLLGDVEEALFLDTLHLFLVVFAVSFFVFLFVGLIGHFDDVASEFFFEDLAVKRQVVYRVAYVTFGAY